MFGALKARAKQALRRRLLSVLSFPAHLSPENQFVHLRLTKENGNPNINPIWEKTKDAEIISWNIKNFGYLLARKMAEQRPLTPGLLANLPLESKATRQADIESPWFAYWCSQLKIPVTYHRKVWEYCFLLQALHDANMLEAGRRGLGFACGEEPIPSYLASSGIDVTATDLEPEKVAGRGWAETGQHTSSIEKLWYSNLVEREAFDKHVKLKYVDMNAIPSTLTGYDFCWSICSLEHLGSIEQGLKFIENSLRVLRPGGLAVHTTEFNISNDGPTIDHWPTVLFQKKHFESVAERLRNQGHWVAPLNFDFGDGPIDNFIDVPPYDWDRLSAHGHLSGQKEHPAHLKLAIDGFPCTCFGMVIRKK
jgi:SAM-dependent methyltransferase